VSKNGGIKILPELNNYCFKEIDFENSLRSYKEYKHNSEFYKFLEHEII